MKTSPLRYSVLLVAAGTLLGGALPAGEIAPADCKVSASRHETASYGDFKPELTLDGKMDKQSSWRGEGDGVWIQYDIVRVQPLAALKLAFLSGDKNVYSFDVLLSEDGEKWVPFAEKLKSSGKTLEFESFDLKGTPARLVRVVGHGSTSAKFPEWFNLTETRIETKE